MQSAHPELADIPSSREAGVGGDSSFVFSYLRDDGSFALVVKRGGGDCPAGCTDNEYWYFETDAMCAPQAIGHYHAGFDNSGNCFTIEGERQWNVPSAVDPTYICGESKAAQSISGTHHFHATGVRWPCALAGQSLDTIQIDKTITLEIAQNAADLSRGEVTLSGLGESWLDGRAFDALFTRQRFEVHVNEQSPSTCIRSHSLQLSYDFEGFGPGQLNMMDVDTPDCDPNASTISPYCKGQLMLTLSARD